MRVVNPGVDDWNADQSMSEEQVKAAEIDKTVKSVVVGTDFNLNFKKIAMAVVAMVSAE